MVWASLTVRRRAFCLFLTTLVIAAVATWPQVARTAEHESLAPSPLGGRLAQTKKLHLFSPVSGKVSPALNSVLSQFKAQGITRGNARARGAGALSNPLVHVDVDGSIHVYVYLYAFGPVELAELRRLEVAIEITNEELGAVQAWVPFDQIERLAALPFVGRITPPSYAVARAGSVTTEGDRILGADRVRALGFDGSGVKVGAISIGANSRSAAQATGDLPPGITVFGTCTTSFVGACDEGTAMMEIIHDLAPGAQLGFGASSTSFEFIQRVNDLANTFGAHVIVDDLAFFGEPYFEDGPVARAVAAVTDRAICVSAAGNDAEGHYEADYRTTILQGANVHDFGATAGGPSDPTMNIRVNPGGGLIVVLQWNDPFGASGNDYDLFFLNQAETDVLCVTCVSDDFQTGFQDPIEVILYLNNTGTPVTGKVVVEKFDGLDRRLEMFLLFVSGTVVVEQYNVPQASVFGHAAVPGAMAVGAIAANDPGNDTIEPFSSRGPSTVFFPTVQQRLKPDIAGIDNVSVTGAGGFPSRFLGTSAAAPHVAGIAALLKSGFPTAAPSRIAAALKAAAVDLGPPGPDNIFGTGRVDAFGANSRLKPKDMPWLLILLQDD